MSCCPPSITPDYSGDSGGGSSSGVQTVTAGTNVSITGSGTNPIINALTGASIVSSIEGLSGAVNLIGNNISITTSGQDITLTASGSTSYPNITAGAGISVTGTAATPVITNLNPSPSYPAISAGSGITVGGTAAAPVITNTNPTPVYPTISAGAGITVNNTNPAAPIITNTNPTLITVNAGVGISVDNTNPLSPTINNTNPTPVYPSISAGAGISVTGTAAAPIITNTASSGYPNITAGAGITVGGTAAAPVITNTNPTPVYPTISAGAGITVNNINPAAPIITNTNPTPITVNPGVGISVDNTNPLAPIISNNNATPFTLNNQAGSVFVTNSDSKLSINAAANAVDITVPNIVETLNGLQGKLSLTSTSLTITPDSGSNSISIEGGGIAVLRPLYTIFVSPNGDDNTGIGSVTKPFATIQKAIDYRQNNIAEIIIVEILIYAGVYPEDLTITMGNTILSGYSSSQYDLPQVVLNGSSISSSFININLTIAEGFVLVGFVNITMNETVIEKTITASTTSTGGGFDIAFNNCNINGTINVTSSTFQKQSSISITNCNIKCSNSSNSLLVNAGCILNILQSQLEHTNHQNLPVVDISSNGVYQGVINCQYSKITSSSGETALYPIIKINILISNTYFDNILYSTINYTSGTPDTGTNKCCIQFNLSAALFHFVYSIADNIFLCAGVTGSTNNECIQCLGSVGQVNISNFGNNYAAPNANKISTNLLSLGNILIPVTV